jgi:hypothetical protein
MNPWLPVIATLSGAIVAGTISILVALISNRFAKWNADIALREERAKWAVERRLQGLESLYASLERVEDAAQKHRIARAWKWTQSEEPDLKIPEWVSDENDARAQYEDAVGDAISKTLLMDEELVKEFEKARENYWKWFGSRDHSEGVNALLSLEGDLGNFRRAVAQQYRATFHGRRIGTDIS